MHTADLIYAKESGIFEENGVSVTTEIAGGGAEAVPLLVSGEYDVVFSTLVTAILGASKGVPLKIASANNVGGEDQGIYVEPNSGIEETADLSGKRVAVNTLANTATPVIQAIVEEDGGDPDTIQFVELPFPDMISALDRGDVDAIWQPEPFGAVARGEGLTWLTKMFVGGPADALPLSCWITIDTVADDKGEALDAFDRSVVEARNAIDSDRTILEEIVPMYTELSPDLIAKVEPPVYRDDYTVEDVQRVADMMYKYDMLDEEFDASTLFLD